MTMQARELAALRAMVNPPMLATTGNVAAGPTAHHSDVQRVDTMPDRRWTRRAVITGAAAAAATAAAGATASPALAAAGGSVIMGVDNNADATQTTLRSSNATRTLTVSTSSATASAVRMTSPTSTVVCAGSGGVSSTSTTGFAASLASTTGPALVLSAGVLAEPPLATPPAVGSMWAVRSPTMLDDEYQLWINVGGAPPSKFVMLASLASAGAYVPIDPARVFDSRYQPPVGPVVKGAPRLFNVRDSYFPATNTIRELAAIPAGATAVTVNLTVTGTNSSGYAALERGVATEAQWSSINWGGANQTIANGLTVMLDNQRRLKAFVEGAPGTRADVIVDVTGYYQARTDLDG